MKKFNFWFPNSKRVVMQQFNKENPFSGIDGSLNDAQLWAENLLRMNPDESRIEYMVENGRKIYNACKWFDNYGNLLGEIPQDCINDCTQPGKDAAEDVLY